MNDNQLHTPAQIQAFLDGTAALEFSVAADARDGLIARTVRRFGYTRLPNHARGTVTTTPKPN